MISPTTPQMSAASRAAEAAQKLSTFAEGMRRRPETGAGVLAD